jgi:hypothetical protein
VIGYTQHVETDKRPFQGEQEIPNAISVVVSKDFPDEAIIRETLKRGIEAEGDMVWVVRGTPIKGDAANIVVDVLHENGIEPIFAETNRTYWGATAGKWRDLELLSCVKMCVVFHDVNSSTTKWFAERVGPHVKVIERGTKKAVKRTRKGRKPVGV